MEFIAFFRAHTANAMLRRVTGPSSSPRPAVARGPACGAIPQQAVLFVYSSTVGDLVADLCTRPLPVGRPFARGDVRDPERLNGVTVASVCDVCGKGPGFGNSVSHSHRRTRRRWNPNIQTVRTRVGGTPKRVNACTSCIKAGKVTR